MIQNARTMSCTCANGMLVFHSVTSAALSVCTPVDIHELYQWNMLNWSITKVRNCTHIALPQPTYKTPNDVETSDQSQNFSGDVSGRFPSPAGSA